MVTLHHALFLGGSLFSLSYAETDIPLIKTPSEAIIFSKKSFCTVLGYTKEEEQDLIFEDLAKELADGCTFATASSQAMMDKYELTKSDLPAAVLLRNFNDEGKDIKNRREARVASVKRQSIDAWGKEALKKFVTTQGVPPVIVPGGGPDDKPRWNLAMKSPLPKLLWYYESRKQAIDVFEAFRVPEDELSEFFAQVNIVMLHYEGDDEFKKQMREMGRLPESTKMTNFPMVVGGGKVIAQGLKTSKAIQKELRKILKLEGPKKKVDKSGFQTLADARRAWWSAKVAKVAAVEVEEFLVARDEFEKQKMAWKHMEALAENPEDLTLAALDTTELKTKLAEEADEKKKKAIEDLIREEL